MPGNPGNDKVTGIPNIVEDGDPNHIFGTLDEYSQDEANGSVFIKMLQALNMCAAKIIDDFDLRSEVKEVMNYMFSEEWIQIVENGASSSDDFKVHLAYAIDPLTTKVLGVSGDDFATSMSYEMGQWIKDTSILWIKNKGAGNTTTEYAILEL